MAEAVRHIYVYLTDEELERFDAARKAHYEQSGAKLSRSMFAKVAMHNFTKSVAAQQDAAY